MKRLEWFVAGRYLASRRRRRRLLSLSTFIAIGGVAVGVMALLIVIAVMTGLQRDLQAKILAGAPHVYVYGQGDGLRTSGWQQARDRIAEVPGVTAVAPILESSIMVARSLNYARPGKLTGIVPGAGGTPLYEVERAILDGDYSLGAEVATATELPGALMGSALAAGLAVIPGDTVLIGTLENLKAGPFGWNPPVRQFVVTGLFQTGMYEYDSGVVYVHLAAAQDLLGLSADTVGMLAANVSDPWRAAEVAAEISNTLGWPYHVQTWIDLNGQLFSALKLEKLAMAVILSLIVLVASFNIVSLLTMVVADKRREIGILKSMGMTDGSVLRIFMLQGVTIGAVGTLIGGVLGGLTIWVIDYFGLIRIPPTVYFIDTLPLALDVADVVLIIAVSMLISFIATVYPALQAAGLQPVDAIRDD